MCLAHKKISNLNEYIDKYLSTYSVDSKIINKALLSASESLDTVSSEETIRILIKHHADVNIADSDGKSVLINIVSYAESEDIIKLILDHGADVNHQDDDGWTALMFATHCQQHIPILLKYDADINGAENDGMTPLMIAVQIYDSNIEDLLKYKPNINKQDKYGRTALMYAAWYSINPYYHVSILLENKADFNLKDHNGFSAFNCPFGRKIKYWKVIAMNYKKIIYQNLKSLKDVLEFL